MLQKFSVRKPFTVLVGVILVIVLGVVSFMNTTTDLLPAMDLPYSAVITMYVGATPEQVERDVTIPLETRLSTLGGIDTVQSISSEHISIVIMQFTGNTNMDSASLEIRETLDMMTLPDGVSRPMTIRINPEMMPIMAAAVHMEGVTIDELSEFARNEISTALEGVPGVAVVSLSGLVRNQVHVVISEDKINEANEKISLVVTAMIEEAMEYAKAEMAKQAEAMIDAGVREFSSIRLAELMNEEEYSLEEAQMILHMELPAAIEAITNEVMETLAAEFGGGAESEETEPIGIPADMLTVDIITGMLTAQDFSMPAGMLTDGGSEYMMRVGERFSSLEDIESMLIFDPAQMGLSGLEPVRLSDVADVFISDDSHLSYTRVNGNPSVMLTIQRQSEFPTADVASAVRERMDLLMADNPDLGFAILMDQGEMIGTVVGSVLDNLLIGGLLAIIILLLFLRDVRPTLIVAVSIPISLMLAFTLMYFTGISLNMISMGGLALAVGMLVDNSIVVIENIYRMRSTTGRSAARSAVSGAKQVAGAIAASSLTTIAVFLPIVFTSGITRQLFADLGLTIAYSLLASLIIALTVVPAASSVMFKKMNLERTKEGKLFTRFVNGYETALRFSLRYKWIVLVFSVAAFALSFWVLNMQGMEMFPPSEMPQITVTAEMPEDSTFEQTVEVADLLSERVMEIADVETVGVSVGGGMMQMFAASMGMGNMGNMGAMGGGGAGGNITMYVLLGDSRTLSNEEISSKIRDIGDSLGLEASVDGGAGADMSILTGDAISLRIEGRELDALRDTAIELSELVRSVEGTLNVTDIAERAAPELRVTVDRDNAMARGLTVAQIFMAVREAITAPEGSLNMTLSGRSHEIIVSDGSFVSPDRDGMENLLISSRGGDVSLSDIAYVYEDVGFTSINRINSNRYLTISGEIEDGYNVGLVNAEIERLLEDFTPAEGCQIIISGEMEAITGAMNDLYLMLLLALVFIYLIMVAQFQSLLSPFIIMFTIVLAFTGGFFGLLIAGMPLSIVAMIGLILLTGVVVNNGIVFISRVNQMRWEGMPKKDALIDAGRKRIRPILMTALTTIFAMSVMAVGVGEGTEMMQPMAVATIGGLLYATAMTLFVVPVLYDMMHRDKDIKQEDLDAREPAVKEPEDNAGAQKATEDEPGESGEKEAGEQKAEEEKPGGPGEGDTGEQKAEEKPGESGEEDAGEQKAEEEKPGESAASITVNP